MMMMKMTTMMKKMKMTMTMKMMMMMMMKRMKLMMRVIMNELIFVIILIVMFSKLRKAMILENSLHLQIESMEECINKTRSMGNNNLGKGNNSELINRRNRQRQRSKSNRNRIINSVGVILGRVRSLRIQVLQRNLQINFNNRFLLHKKGSRINTRREARKNDRDSPTIIKRLIATTTIIAREQRTQMETTRMEECLLPR